MKIVLRASAGPGRRRPAAEPGPTRVKSLASQAAMWEFALNQEGIMAKGNNAQKKETKKPKKAAVKGAADKPKDKKK
jgi:hypothetical protein